MASGGPRSGTPGKAYPNRTDLQGDQPIRVATGQPYGAATQQREMQQAVPLPQAGGLFDATARPEEPVQSGLPIGPGEGPMNIADLDDLALLEALYEIHPTAGLGKLIERQVRLG